MSDQIISFVGDFRLPRAEYSILPALGRDLTVINLEGAITNSTRGRAGKICLASDPESIRPALRSGLLIANLANNHILDFDQQGVDDTIEALTDAGVPFFGAGTPDDNFNNPLIVTVGSHSVALLGYVCPSTHPGQPTTSGFQTAPLDPTLVTSDTKLARARGAEIVIVSLHWGEEQVPVPKPADVAMANVLAGLGVDLIIGHHAHCSQPSCSIGKTHVFFGLGNAVFPDFDVDVPGKGRYWAKQRWWNTRSLMVKFNVHTRAHSVERLVQRSNGARVSLTRLGAAKVRRIRADQLGQVARLYAIAKRYGTFRYAAARMLARPRMPSWASVRALLSAMRERS